MNALWEFLLLLFIYLFIFHFRFLVELLFYRSTIKVICVVASREFGCIVTVRKTNLVPRSPAANEEGLTFPMQDRVRSGYVITVRGFNNTYVLIEVQQPPPLYFSAFSLVCA